MVSYGQCNLLLRGRIDNHVVSASPNSNAALESPNFWNFTSLNHSQIFKSLCTGYLFFCQLPYLLHLPYFVFNLTTSCSIERLTTITWENVSNISDRIIFKLKLSLLSIIILMSDIMGSLSYGRMGLHNHFHRPLLGTF